MSVAKNEQEQPNEFEEDGGPLQDPENFKPVEYFNLEIGLDFKVASLRGKIGAPAPFAPLAFMLVAIMVGGIIWATWLWQAGAAVMVASLVVYLISIFVRLRR
jgi:fatty acid desaturase